MKRSAVVVIVVFFRASLPHPGREPKDMTLHSTSATNFHPFTYTHTNSFIAILFCFSSRWRWWWCAGGMSVCLLLWIAPSVHGYVMCTLLVGMNNWKKERACVCMCFNVIYLWDSAGLRFRLSPHPGLNHARRTEHNAILLRVEYTFLT